MPRYVSVLTVGLLGDYRAQVQTFSLSFENATLHIRYLEVYWFRVPRIWFIVTLQKLASADGLVCFLKPVWSLVWRKQSFSWHQLRQGTYMAVASHLLISWFRGEYKEVLWTIVMLLYGEQCLTVWEHIIQQRELYLMHSGDLTGKSKREGIYVWLIHYKTTILQWNKFFKNVCGNVMIELTFLFICLTFLLLFWKFFVLI